MSAPPRGADEAIGGRPAGSAATAELGFHPLANLFPLTEGAEFEALKQDVAANGLRETVVLFEGQMLDGCNRYRACRQTGTPCRFRVYDGHDPVAYVIPLNLRSSPTPRISKGSR